MIGFVLISIAPFHYVRSSSLIFFAAHQTTGANAAIPPRVPTAISALLHHVLAATNELHTQLSNGPKPRA